MNLHKNIPGQYLVLLVLMFLSVFILLDLQVEAQTRTIPKSIVMVNGDMVDTTLKFTEYELSRDRYLQIYGLNDLTNVTITQYEVSNFPVIRAWVRVTDENGDAILGLQHSNFYVTENGLAPSFDVDSVGGGQNPISVSLVIDRSGSMGADGMQDAKDAANEFVDNMTDLDRAAIVSFESVVTVDQPMTSDKNLLHNAINSLTYGGGTAMYDGIYEGLVQCAGETGIKAVIAFTDGDENSSVYHNETDVINYANTINCPIYTIGVGSYLNPTPLQTLASSTGGDYYYAPSSEDIAQIYQDISQSIEDQYLVAFNSPNPVKDGTSRTVVITVEENAFTDDDSFTYTAPLDVDDAPVITLTSETQNLINSTQIANQPITITVEITDDQGVATARLFYRVTDTGIYTQVDMVNTSGNIYEYTIPGDEVLDPGMQFYFTSSDNDGHSVSSPSLQPYDFPYSFAVLPNEAPQITHTPVVQSTIGRDIVIDAMAVDATNVISEVKLYFRNHANVLYQQTAMNNIGGDNYQGTIPGTYVDTVGVDYFISAWDDYGVRSDYGSSDVPLFIEGLESLSMYIIVEDNNGFSQLLRFGTADDATDGYDPDYDQYAPPLPPSGAADARFSKDGEDYLKDFRATNTNIIVWNLSYQVSFDGDPATLIWDNSTFPEGRFWLKDAITENGDFVDVDMMAQNSYIITDPNITELEIVYSVEACFTKIVDSGWNLVGLPSEVTDSYYLSVFPSAMSGTLYGFDGTYFTEDSLDLGEGYWLRFENDESMQICGFRVDSLTLNLTEGWNLISGPSGDVALNDVDDPQVIIIPSTLFGFDGAYFLTDSIKQGYGYWIRVSDNGQIKLTSPESGLPKNSITQFALDRVYRYWTELTIADARGKEQRLYFDAQGAGLDQTATFALPPLPPIGAFDVRFSGGYWATESAEPRVEIMAEQFPLTLKMDVSKAKEFAEYQITEIYANGQGDSYPLTGGSTIQLNNPMVEGIQISKLNVIPLTFYVEQNYPNPFNPETEIRYILPEKGKVDIAVYNTLGQKIKTLLVTEQKAGNHSVKWDGTNADGALQSSGVYFYKIKAGSNMAIRKMVLIK